jgi:hypothetical protein
MVSDYGTLCIALKATDKYGHTHVEERNIQGMRPSKNQYN